MGEYYKTKESVKEYIELAKDVNGLELIDLLKQYLPEHSELLEVGSGPGTDWRILNAFYKVTGSDNSLLFLDYLRKENKEGLFLHLDASSLDTLEKFAGIYSNKVLHHLTDDELKQSVKRQYEIVDSKGIICHSFWKGSGSEVFKGLFVNYHTKESLEEVFGKYFEILLMQDYAEFDPSDSILLIGRKK